MARFRTVRGGAVVPGVVALALPLALACSGLLNPIDDARVAAAAAELEATPPAERYRTLLGKAANTGLFAPECSEALRALEQGDAVLRETYFARGLAACGATCPPLASAPDILTGIKLSAANVRVPALRSICEQRGLPDQVFGGILAPLSTGFHPTDYLTFRLVFEALQRRLSDTPAHQSLYAKFDKLRPSIAIGLDAGEPNVAPDPSIISGGAFTRSAQLPGETVALGTVSSEALKQSFTDAAPEFAACVFPQPAPAVGNGELLRSTVIVFDGVYRADGTTEIWISQSRVSPEQADCATAVAAKLSLPKPTSDEPVLFSTAVFVWPGVNGDFSEKALLSAAISTGGAIEANRDFLGDAFGSIGVEGERFGGGGTTDWPKPEAAQAEPSAPVILMPTVRGSLSKDVVYRVARRQLGSVRYCQEEASRNAPGLVGRVEILFTIREEGAVETAKVVNTTVNNASLEACLTSTVGRWTFPAPDGDKTIVNMRFSFGE